MARLMTPDDLRASGHGATFKNLPAATDAVIAPQDRRAAERRNAPLETSGYADWAPLPPDAVVVAPAPQDAPRVDAVDDNAPAYTGMGRVVCKLCQGDVATFPVQGPDQIVGIGICTACHGA